jgi:hypothetical protein
MPIVDDNLLIRRPFLDVETLVINGYSHSKTVTEVRVRWRPSQPNSKNPLGHFLIIVDLFSPAHEAQLKAIEAEIGARIAPTAFDMYIEYKTLGEAMRLNEYAIIMRRPWEWYYQTGKAIPKQAET